MLTWSVNPLKMVSCLYYERTRNPVNKFINKSHSVLVLFVLLCCCGSLLWYSIVVGVLGGAMSFETMVFLLVILVPIRASFNWFFSRGTQ